MDTLFKDASDTIQEYAANAYKTAGVSANTYMQQATAFSASLIQSLGGDTEAAAEYANQAIMDMSDNANKMGTDIESIQQTYQSLMRGNYAMLDNLKLGYGGTKSELERLVADAEKLTGQALDPSKFSDVITAIHAVQENIGITGTTAAEAATTIEGSVGMMRAAWSNLITGIADENADLGTLIGSFVASVETAAGNIIPRVTQILSGIGTAIEQLAPIITAEVPVLITSVLPSLVSAGAQLLIGLVTGIISATPQLVQAVPGIITSIVTAIQSSAPSLMQAGSSLLSMIGAGIVSGVPALLAQLPAVVNGILTFITSRLPSFMEGGKSILLSIQDGIINSISSLVDALPEVITAIITFITENLPTVLEAGVDILVSLVNGIMEAIPQLVGALPEIISAITNGLAAAAPKVISAGVRLLQSLIEGIIATIPNLVAALPQIVNAIINGIGALMGGIVNIGKSIVEGVWEGISSMVSWFTDKVTGFFGGIVDSVLGLLGIHSPSRVFAGIGENMALGLGQGWDNEYGRIKGQIENGMNFETSTVDFASSGLGTSSAGIINGVSSAMQSSGANSFTFNLLFPDGTKFASYAFQPMVDYAKANGTPILNPT